MSAIVKLAAKLPGEEEINGLDKWAEEFCAFEGPVCAIVWLDARAEREAEEISRVLDADTFYQTTGLPEINGAL